METSEFGEIEAVIFDIGRVLVKVDLSRGVLRYFNTQDPAGDAEVLRAIFNNPVFRAYECGEMDPRHFFDLINRDHRLPSDWEDFLIEWNDVFDPWPEMEELFREVQTRWPVTLLSDIDQLHWNFLLAHYPIFGTVPNPALSFRLGHMKPHPRTYETAAGHVGYPVAKCLFIDDREDNIAGARAVGMPAILFTSPDELRDRLRSAGILP